MKNVVCNQGADIFSSKNTDYISHSTTLQFSTTDGHPMIQQINSLYPATKSIITESAECGKGEVKAFITTGYYQGKMPLGNAGGNIL